MTFWEIFALIGLVATILGVSFTICGFFNNKTIKEGAKIAQEILNRIEQGQREATKATTALLARIERGQEEGARATREIIDRIERGQEELRKEVVEDRKEMIKVRGEMAEAIKYLAKLMVAESEKTRQVIRGLP